MLIHKEQQWKRIAVAILAIVSLTTPASAAFPGDKAAHAPGEGAGRSLPAEGTAEIATGGPSTPAPNTANAALALELQQLKESVQAQAQKLSERTIVQPKMKRLTESVSRF